MNEEADVVNSRILGPKLAKIIDKSEAASIRDSDFNLAFDTDEAFIVALATNGNIDFNSFLTASVAVEEMEFKMTSKATVLMIPGTPCLKAI